MIDFGCANWAGRVFFWIEISITLSAHTRPRDLLGEEKERDVWIEGQGNGKCQSLHFTGCPVVVVVWSEGKCFGLGLGVQWGGAPETSGNVTGVWSLFLAD